MCCKWQMGKKANQSNSLPGGWKTKDWIYIISMFGNFVIEYISEVLHQLTRDSKNFPKCLQKSKRKKKPSLKFLVVYLQKMAEIVHFIDPNNSQLVRRRFQHFHFMFIFLLEHFMMLTIPHAKTVTCSMSWQFLSVNIFLSEVSFRCCYG